VTTARSRSRPSASALVSRAEPALAMLSLQRVGSASAEKPVGAPGQVTA